MNPLTAAEFAALLTAIVGYLAFHWKVTREDRKKIESSQKVIHEQIVNSHTVNLRDDIDKKHEEVLAAIGRIDGRQLEIEKRLRDERMTRESNDNQIKEEHRRMWRAINRKRHQ